MISLTTRWMRQSMTCQQRDHPSSFSSTALKETSLYLRGSRAPLSARVCRAASHERLTRPEGRWIPISRERENPNDSIA
jgi:hypothetical protein